MTEALTLSPAEAEFERILREHGFKTATMKQYVKAPSLQGVWGDYIILPDIIAVDKSGRGWCFEVKSEKESRQSMQCREMPMGYAGPVWFLEEHKMRSYLDFSKAFFCPCIIIINGDFQWKAGFFTRINLEGDIEYNKDLVVARWKDDLGCPVLFNVMDTLDRFFENLENSLEDYGWKPENAA